MPAENCQLFLTKVSTFQEWLIRLRQSKGISQSELVRMSGLLSQELSYFERGERGASDKMLRRIAKVKALGVTYGELRATRDMYKLTAEQIREEIQVLQDQMKTLQAYIQSLQAAEAPTPDHSSQ